MSKKIQRSRFKRLSINSKPGIIALMGSMGTMMTISFMYLLALAN
jgi:hypothetical protein